MKIFLFFIVLLLISSSFLFSQVSVNTDGSNPDNSAMLDVKSTTKGMLVPRMTLTQRNVISNPATGLMIFCTDDNKFYYNTGSPASPVWLVLNTQWVANGSNISFNSGAVSIGTNLSPKAKLDVYGNIAVNGTPVINAQGQWVGSTTGLAGPQGVQGIQGLTGANGKTVLNGTVDPAIGIGTVGDFYINTLANKIFGPKTSNGWGNGVSLVGPQGIQGSAGANGLQGPQGVQGPQGLTGANGATGPQGPVGPAVSTLAVCVDPSYSDGISRCYDGQCNCSGGTVVSSVKGPCTVTSNTGTCSARSITTSWMDVCLGSCCVCTPK